LLFEENEELIKEKKSVEKFLATFNKVLNLNPHDTYNDINYLENQLETIKMSFEQNGIKSENLSIFEFYKRIEFLEKKYNNLENGSSK